MSLCLYVAVLWLVVTGTVSCAAGRHSAADSQSAAPQENLNAYPDSKAAASQPVDATASGGADRLDVQDQARQAARVLKRLLGSFWRTPNVNPKVVSGLTRDVAQLSAALDAIADSRNNQEFTAAVLALCEPEPAQAATRVGPLLVGMGARISANPPANVPANQAMGWAEYLDRLGETLVRVPQRCRDIKAAIAQTDAQTQAGGQTQAEAETQSESEGERPPEQNQAERRRRASMMLLCIAGGMLGPSSSRYRMGTTARFGYALEHCGQ